MLDRATRAVSSVPQRWRWWILAAVVVVQSAGLYLPGAHGPATDLPLDKLTHFLIFVVVAAVAVWAGIPWAVAGVLLLAQTAASELVQHFWLSDRAGQWGDVVADAAGIAAGLAVGIALAAPTPNASAPSRGSSEG